MSYTQPLTRATVNFHSDDELLPALKKQDEDAIKYIYRNYWPMVMKLVKANSGNEEEAKDVFQESILDFLEKIWSEKFVLTCKSSTYFYSVFRNKWFHHLRGNRAFVDIDDYVVLTQLAEDPVQDRPVLPGDEQIQQAILSLGEPCRSLLIGFYYEGLSMEEMAAKMGYKDAKVAKQQKFRCKDRLTQAISKLFKLS